MASCRETQLARREASVNDSGSGASRRFKAAEYEVRVTSTADPRDPRHCLVRQTSASVGRCGRRRPLRQVPCGSMGDTTARRDSVSRLLGFERASRLVFRNPCGKSLIDLELPFHMRPELSRGCSGLDSLFYLGALCLAHGASSARVQFTQRIRSSISSTAMSLFESYAMIHALLRRTSNDASDGALASIRV